MADETAISPQDVQVPSLLVVPTLFQIKMVCFGMDDVRNARAKSWSRSGHAGTLPRWRALSELGQKSAKSRFQRLCLDRAKFLERRTCRGIRTSALEAFHPRSCGHDPICA